MAAAVVTTGVLTGTADAAAPSAGRLQAPGLATVAQDFPWLEGGHREASHSTTLYRETCAPDTQPSNDTADTGVSASYWRAAAWSKPTADVQVVRFASVDEARAAWESMHAAARRCAGSFSDGHYSYGTKKVLPGPHLGQQSFAFRVDDLGTGIDHERLTATVRRHDLIEVSTVSGVHPVSRGLMDALARDLWVVNR